MNYTVHIGCTVSAYARINVEANSKEELQAKVKEVFAERFDHAMEAEWGSADDYRIVGVDDEDREDPLTPAELQALADSVEKEEAAT